MATTTFGKMIMRLRKKQGGVTFYTMEARGGPRENHMSMLTHARRPEVKFATLRKIVQGMTHNETQKPLAAMDRLQLVAAVHSDRALIDLETLAIYILWALGQPQVMRNLLEDLRGEGFHEEITQLLDRSAPAQIDNFEIYEALAEDKQMAPLRAALVDRVIERVEINLHKGYVRLYPAPFAAHLFAEAGAIVVAENTSSRARRWVDFPLLRSVSE